MNEQQPEVEPIGPGDVLRHEVLGGPVRITQEELAQALKVSRHSINELVNGRRGVTADMALRLAHVLDTDPDFWLNLQRDIDLHRARRKVGPALETLKVLRQAPEVD